MTVIHVSLRHGVPIVMADVLLTADGKEEHAVLSTIDTLPDAGTLDNPVYAWGACQKIFRLGDHCAFGFSCRSLNDIVPLLQVLIDKFGQYGPATLDDLQSSLTPYQGKFAGRYVALAGWFVSESAVSFSWDATKGFSSGHKKVTLGTGSEFVKQLSDRKSITGIREDKSIKAYDKALQETLTFLGRALVREDDDPHIVLKNRAGGGLQFLLWSQERKKFEWLPDALAMLWKFDFGASKNSGDQPQPRRFLLSITTEQDAPVYDRCEVKSIGDGRIEVIRCERFAPPRPWDAERSKAHHRPVEPCFPCSNQVHGVLSFGGKMVDETGADAFVSLYTDENNAYVWLKPVDGERPIFAITINNGFEKQIKRIVRSRARG